VASGVMSSTRRTRAPRARSRSASTGSQQLAFRQRMPRPAADLAQAPPVVVHAVKIDLASGAWLRVRRLARWRAGEAAAGPSSVASQRIPHGPRRDLITRPGRESAGRRCRHRAPPQTARAHRATAGPADGNDLPPDKSPACTRSAGRAGAPRRAAGSTRELFVLLQVSV